MRILAIPIIKHVSEVYRKRSIFRRQFLHLNSVFLRRQTFENYLHSTKNSFPKKELQLRENYESLPRILQSVPILLAHTLVAIAASQVGSRLMMLLLPIASGEQSIG